MLYILCCLAQPLFDALDNITKRVNAITSNIQVVAIIDLDGINAALQPVDNRPGLDIDDQVRELLAGVA